MNRTVILSCYPIKNTRHIKNMSKTLQKCVITNPKHTTKCARKHINRTLGRCEPNLIWFSPFSFFFYSVFGEGKIVTCIHPFSESLAFNEYNTKIFLNGGGVQQVTCYYKCTADETTSLSFGCLDLVHTNAISDATWAAQNSMTM